ncbi:MAG: hypothetical protein WCB49_06680 [Gammaproteobacteria bacterium]
MPSTSRPHRQVYGPQDASISDESVQEGILSHLIELYPAQLTIGEVVRDMTVASTVFCVVDQVERAIRDLIRVGLVHRNGDFLFASRAAVRSEALRL